MNVVSWKCFRWFVLIDVLTFAAVGQCKWEAGLTRMFKIAGAAIKNRRELDDETDMC